MSAPLVNNVMHWGYGMVNGALYGVVAGSPPRARIGCPLRPSNLPAGAGREVLAALGRVAERRGHVSVHQPAACPSLRKSDAAR